MPIQKSQALVLRKQELRETSVIVTFLTREHGKIQGILRGVRGERGTQGGAALELFALDEIVFYDRKRGDIFTVSQFDLVDFFAPVRADLDKLSYAVYMMELVDVVTTLGDTLPEVFDLTVNTLKLLSTDASTKRVVRIFEIKLLSLLGLMPGLSECVNCGGVIDQAARFSFRNGGLVCGRCLSQDKLARPVLAGTIKFMEFIQSAPFDKVDRVKVSADVGRELELVLRKFIEFHVERRLKTLDFLKSVGEK